MNFITYKQLKRDVIAWSNVLPQYDAIVGIERSGIIPGTILALHRNIPYMNFNEYLEGTSEYIRSKVSKKDVIRVLVVDDSESSGGTLRDVRNCLGNRVEYGVVYSWSGGPRVADFTFTQVELPRMFEWNWQHNDNLSKAVIDIDGVLCHEPPVEDNTDAYIAYLNAPTPLYIPSRPVLALATGRLEKYRDITEAWLKKVGVEYKHLIMAQYDTPQERRADNRVPHHKAQALLDLEGEIFIESSDWQSEIIHNMTGKTVISIESL